MFERLFDFLAGILDLFKFWVVLDEFEGGVILRLGSYHRHLHVGINWLVPLGVESYYSDNIVTKTDNLVSQSLSTKDGESILISAIIKYKIKNIKRWLLDVEDASSVLADITYSVIAENVAETEWENVKHPAFRSDVHSILRSRSRKHLGVELQDIQFCDMSRAKALRLIND